MGQGVYPVHCRKENNTNYSSNQHCTACKTFHATPEHLHKTSALAGLWVFDILANTAQDSLGMSIKSLESHHASKILTSNFHWLFTGSVGVGCTVCREVFSVPQAMVVRLKREKSPTLIPLYTAPFWNTVVIGIQSITFMVFMLWWFAQSALGKMTEQCCFFSKVQLRNLIHSKFYNEISF